MGPDKTGWVSARQGWGLAVPDRMAAGLVNNHAGQRGRGMKSSEPKLSRREKLGIAAVVIALSPVLAMVLFMFVVGPWFIVIKWVLG
jgi:hypothetical protein